MATTLKLKVTGRTEVGNDQVQLNFGADYDDGKNAEWARYTPSASLSFVVKTECAAADYQIGTAVTVTLDESAE